MHTGTLLADAEQAFTRASRARRRAALARWVQRRPAACAQLAVHDPWAPPGRHGTGRVREIPVDRIDGTVEPARAALFDGAFRPRPAARSRWQRVWQAEQRGVPLPPISVVPVGDRFAVRDGHHRVSVARARGATTIDAYVS